MLPPSYRTAGWIGVLAGRSLGGIIVKIVLQIITCWVVLSSSVIIPFLAWAYFRAQRQARRDEAAHLADWLGSEELKPPS
jgi:hypothetical protein